MLHCSEALAFSVHTNTLLPREARTCFSMTGTLAAPGACPAWNSSGVLHSYTGL